MTILILVSAMACGTVAVSALAILVLREVEAERTDLATEAHRCTQTLTRYQA